MDHKCVYCRAPLPDGASFCHCCAKSQLRKKPMNPPRRPRARGALYAAAACAVLLLACCGLIRGRAARPEPVSTAQTAPVPESVSTAPPETTAAIATETTSAADTLTQLERLVLTSAEEALADPDIEAHGPRITHVVEYRAGNWDGKRSTFHGLLIRLNGNFLWENSYYDCLDVLLDMDTGEILNAAQLDYARIRAYQRTVADREQFHHLLLNAYRSFLDDNLLWIWMDSEIREELPQEELDAVNTALTQDLPEEEPLEFGFPGEIPVPTPSYSFAEGALAELENLSYDYSADALAAVAEALKIQSSGPVYMQSSGVRDAQESQFYIVNGEKRGQWALHTNGDQEYVLYHDFDNSIWARHLWVYASGVMMDDYWYADGTPAARFVLTGGGQYNQTLFYPDGKQSYHFIRDTGVEQAEIYAPDGSERLTLNASNTGTELSEYASNGSLTRHIRYSPDGSIQAE